MYNTCRPFILYNDFLPPVNGETTEWQYLSFGSYDGISVGANVLEDGRFDMAALWDYYVQQGKQMKGNFTFQILWGIRHESEERWDAEFWQEDTVGEYPFLFISLIQFQEEKDREGLQKKDRIALEKSLTIESKRKAITYLTIDSSDLILVLRCNSYQDGAEVISSLDFKKNNREKIADIGKVSYSFTVASVSEGYLSDDRKIEQAGGRISHAYIYVIGKDSDIYQQVQEVLGKESVYKEAVLGCDDEVIVVHDVSWNKFLKLFQRKSGVLNHLNAIYRHRGIGVTTIIGDKQVDLDSTIEVEQSEKRDGPKSKSLSVNESNLCAIMRGKCDKINETDNSNRMKVVKRNIFQIINSLYKFEWTPFPDYMFQAVFLAIDMVIDMADAIELPTDEEEFYASFYKFAKRLNLYAHSSWHSDRQFMHVPEINIRIYDTPVKLNAFYNGFIYNLKQYLNGLDIKNSEDAESDIHEYEFLTCPGVANNMQVQELFKGISATKRMFLVEMPENQVYNPSVMLVTLSHEVAHFVGKWVRSREDRVRYAVQVAGKMIMKYVYAELQAYFQGRHDEFLFVLNWNFRDCTERKIVNQLNDFYENYETYLEEKVFKKMSDTECMQLRRMLKFRKAHSEMLKLILVDGIINILENDRAGLWDYIWERDFLFWLEKEPSRAADEKEKAKEKINQIVWRFAHQHIWNQHTISAWSTVDLMVDLFKECIADLMAILVLKLSVSEYLETILQCARDRGIIFRKEDRVINALVLRSSLVVYCMKYDEPEIGFTWKQKDLIKISEEGGQQLKILRTFILNVQADYLEQGIEKRYEEQMAKKRMDSEADDSTEVDMLADVDNLEIILKYLLGCKQKFVDCNIEDSLIKQEELAECYHIFSGNNIEEFTLNMQKYIANYLEEIKRRNRDYADRKGKSSGRDRKILL